MLQQLRDQTQSTGFKVLVVALILVLTLFGFGATAVFSGSDPEVAQIGGYELTQSMLATETERERIRVLSRMGPEFDPSSIDRLELQNYVLQQVIGRQVLSEAGGILGVAVSDAYVNQELVNSPAYQVDGQFNEDIYRQSAQALGYRPVDFMRVVAEDLSREQLRSAVVDSASLPEWELGELVRVVNQRRDLAYLPLTIEAFSDADAVTDDEIAVRYEENQSAYMTELGLDVAYINLSVASLQESQDFEVTQSEIASMYEDDKAAALRDEQRSASHILIQINDNRDEIAAQRLVTEVQTRLNGGETFADLARELSEDAGSKAEGGALGAFARGTFPADFEQALWALADVGDVSDPVLTDSGYHLIQLDGIVEPEYPSLESQTEELTARVKRAKAQELYAEIALELERIAYEERYSLDGVAQELELPLVRAERVSRSATGEDDILAAPAVLDALFSADVLDGSNSEPIELGPEQVVFVRVDNQYPPEPRDLEEVREQIVQELTLEAAVAAIAEAKEVGLAQLLAGESVSSIADSVGGAWQTLTLAPRAGVPDIPQDVLNYAFELPRPPEGQKAVGALDLLDGGAALVTVTRVVPGDIATTTDAEVQQLRGALASRRARIGFESFFLAAEDTVGVTRNLGGAEN